MEELRYQFAEGALAAVIDIRLQQFHLLTHGDDVIISYGSWNKTGLSFVQCDFILRAANAYRTCPLGAGLYHKRIIAHHIAAYRLGDRYHAHAEVLRIQTWISPIDMVGIAVLIRFIHLKIQCFCRQISMQFSWLAI